MEKSNRDFILKWGLILGIAEVAFTLFIYLLGIEWMVSVWMAVVAIIIFVSVPVYCGILWKKNQGGYISFSTGFWTIFLIIAVGGLIFHPFNYTLYTKIDPDLTDKTIEAAAEKTIRVMEYFNAPDEDIEKAMEKFEYEDTTFSASNVITGYLWRLFWGAVTALIGAAVIKKPKAVFEETAKKDTEF